MEGGWGGWRGERRREGRGDGGGWVDIDAVPRWSVGDGIRNIGIQNPDPRNGYLKMGNGKWESGNMNLETRTLNQHSAIQKREPESLSIKQNVERRTQNINTNI